MKKPSGDSLQPNWIDIEDFEFICFNLTRELLSFDEPIPDYSTRDNSLLESSLASPRQAYEITGAGLTEQAAILFYSLIKNHPFRNGNKRIAVISILVFLSLNKKWLDIPPHLLYKLAVIVATSSPNIRSEVLKDTKGILEEYIIDKI
ncbi:MAG: type II toxin-antitoxin system death-on-curing family toxin [Candidatus Levybacteria bacterium]|nr:type II toxin-antitoxin system death-on-curing family toxin [Candidatus Levybacteria bacterium]